MWLAAVFLAAAWLRFVGLDWDQSTHLHPDERFLTMVETAISLPTSVGEYLDTKVSPLNPANRGHAYFTYGTFPLFFVRAVAAVLGRTQYHEVHLVGRVIAALFDLATLALTFRLGLLLAGPTMALVAAALFAFCVPAIQHAHFFTVDAFTIFFTTATLLAGAHVSLGHGLRWHGVFGLVLALAVACRVNLVLLVPLYPPLALLAWWRGRTSFARLVTGGLVAGVVTTVVFRLAQPYAFAGPGFFDVTIAPEFWNSIQTTRAMVRGEVNFPPALQWIGRIPPLYAARNLFLWGLGPAFGLTAVAGLLAVWRRRREPAGDVTIVIFLWAAAFFAYHAFQFAPTLRYFLPIVTVFALAAAALLADVRRPRARTVAIAVVVGLTAAWAFAFTAIYRRPHSRVEASRWIFKNVPAGSAISSEHWDDALPISVDGQASSVYEIVELELFGDDTTAKRTKLVEQLVRVDWVVLSSNRLYGTIPRLPWQYPLARRYYELLFSGGLGFRLERAVTSYPRLGPVEIPDDRAEEAFTVYDHPKVLIFRKTPEFSQERVERLLASVPLDEVVRPSPRDASALYRRVQPSDVPLPGEEKARSAVAAPTRGSATAILRWLVGLELLALMFAVLLAVPFARLPDRGLAFAHVLAWLAPGYVAWLAGALGFGGNRPGLRLLVGVGTLAAIGVLARRGKVLARSFAVARRELVVIECIFLGGFALFALLRAVNPAIFWGEKPMDFAILNATLRSASMPPADPWWAGGALNYYYYGHQVVAAFTVLTGVAPAFAFNLALATTGALVALGAYAAGRAFGGRASGVLAAAGAALLGNFEALRLWLANPAERFDFDTYWASTRLWGSAINEYPWWNLLFGDLHSHVLAQPVSLAVLALGSLWLAERDGTRPVPRTLVFALVAWLGGALAVTSTWSAPVAFAAQLAILGTDAWRSPRRVRALVGAVLLWIGLVVVARLLYWPFWSAYETPGFGWGFETERAPLGAVARYFGVFLVAIVPALSIAFVRGGRRLGLAAIAIVGAALAIAALGVLRSPSAALFAGIAALGIAAWLVEDEPRARAAAALAIVAGAVGCGTEIVFVSDRMNTVFKFYLEMWLLLAVVAGALVPRTLAALGFVGRVVYGLALAVAVAVGLFATATSAVGWARSPFVQSPIPTLDGMAYLEKTRPAELEAYRWLNREIAGVPVLLEAQGPSYQEFGRVSMNTGLPTVLGWEWHLIQQGHSRDRVEERKADVEEIYSTESQPEADRLLRKYGAALVFVGPLERKTYPKAGLAKLDAAGWLDVVFRNRDVTIYGRPGAVETARTWIEPAREGPVFREVPLGRMREPRDLAIAPDGSIVIADFGHRRVQRLRHDGRGIAGFGHEGDGPGEFRDPCGVAVAPDGRIFVADTWNHRVQVFTAEGEPITEWAPGLYGPRGIAIAADESVFVTDTGNRAIVHLGPSGEVLARFGADVLKGPIGITIDRAGEIWVADGSRREVLVFDRSGKLLRSFAVDGWAPSGIVEPYLEVAADGVVWLTDPPGNRVLLYDRDGRALGVATAPGALPLPIGIALLDDRHAIVSSGDKIVTVTRPAGS